MWVHVLVKKNLQSAVSVRGSSLRFGPPADRSAVGAARSLRSRQPTCSVLSEAVTDARLFPRSQHTIGAVSADLLNNRSKDNLLFISIIHEKQSSKTELVPSLKELVTAPGAGLAEDLRVGKRGTERADNHTLRSRRPSGLEKLLCSQQTLAERLSRTEPGVKKQKTETRACSPPGPREKGVPSNRERMTTREGGVGGMCQKAGGRDQSL